MKKRVFLLEVDADAAAVESLPAADAGEALRVRVRDPAAVLERSDVNRTEREPEEWDGERVGVVSGRPGKVTGTSTSLSLVLSEFAFKSSLTRVASVSDSGSVGNS